MMAVVRQLKALEPTCLTRFMMVCTGDDGGKLMFNFYWMNSTFVYVSYALLCEETAPATPAAPRGSVLRTRPPPPTPPPPARGAPHR